MKCLFSFFLVLLYMASFSVSSQPFRSEILEYNTYIEVNGTNYTRTDSLTLKINERMGDAEASIWIPYTKGEKLTIVYAQIEDMQGNVVRRLKKGDIKDQSYISEIALYEDDFIKSFELKHSVYPYIIRYSIKKTIPKFLQIYHLDLRYHRLPIRKGKLTIDYPVEKELKYKEINIAPPTIEKQEKKILYSWEYSYIPETSNRQQHTNYNQSKAPQLVVLPEEFKYGKEGSWKNWQSFGNWIYRLNEKKDLLPETEKQTIDQMLKDVKDIRQKINILYQYLQKNTRYVNVKLDVGGFQAYPAEYVCRNRYGDCKALTNYMQAILKHAGIPSYYTLVYSEDFIYDIDPDFASQEFNHVILTVPVENELMFLECTAKNYPAGYIHTQIQGRQALLTDKDNSRLIRIPALRKEDVHGLRKITVEHNITTLEAVQRGKNYELLSFINTDINKNDAERYLQNSIMNKSNYTLLEYNFSVPDKQPAIHLNARLQSFNAMKKYGNNVILPPFPFEIAPYESPATRKYDLQLNYPFYQTDTIHYHLLETKITKIPEDVVIETEFGTYQTHYMQEGGRVTMVKSLFIPSGNYERTKYPEFYDFIQSVTTEDNKNMYVEVE